MYHQNVFQDPKDHTSLDKGTDTVRNVISGINTESQRGDDKNTEENEQARIPYTSPKPNAIFITSEHEEEIKGKEDGKDNDAQKVQRYCLPAKVAEHKLNNAVYCILLCSCFSSCKQVSALSLCLHKVVVVFFLTKACVSEKV